MEEMHVLLKNRGKINPRSSQEYADRGGFEALKKALSMDSEAIIDVIRASGLRGPLAAIVTLICGRLTPSASLYSSGITGI